MNNQQVTSVDEPPSGLLRQISLWLNGFATQCGHVVAWFTLAIVLITAFNVLSSWLFNVSWIALSESVTWLHAMNFLLAAAYTLNRNEQVRVDIFYQKFSLRGKAWVDLLGSIALLLPLAGFIIWASWPYVRLSYQIGERSAEAGGLPALFILKGLLLAMPLLLIIEALNQITKSLVTLTNKEQC